MRRSTYSYPRRHKVNSMMVQEMTCERTEQLANDEPSVIALKGAMDLQDAMPELLNYTSVKWEKPFLVGGQLS